MRLFFMKLKYLVASVVVGLAVVSSDVRDSSDEIYRALTPVFSVPERREGCDFIYNQKAILNEEDLRFFNKVERDRG